MLSSAGQITVKIPAQLSALVELGEQLRAFLSLIPDLAEPEIILYNIELAVQEIAVNIVKHSYAHYPGEILMSVALSDVPLQLTIVLEDNGISFDPDAIPEPRLGEIQEHGFGLFLVRQLMDEVEYRSENEQNCWRLVKTLQRIQDPMASETQ
ncbi:MAG: ATP-binding protein [Caldilineaceae bacterium]